MLDDFLIESFLFGKVVDFQRVVALPDEDFRTLYHELMQEYQDKDGWWSNGKIPVCRECNGIISSPEQLRRYEGLSMHPKCFKAFYDRESCREKNPVIRAYWQKVANLQ